MRFLLDTNVVSELRKPHGVVDPQVQAWAQRQNVAEKYLSVVTVMEVEGGIRRLERRDAAQAKGLWRWFERAILGEFGDRILPIDLDTARIAAQLHVPDRQPMADTYIAATAQAHGLVVVTRNVKDFTALQARIVDPWAAPSK